MPVDVLIVLGSKTDAEVGKKAQAILKEFGVPHEMVVSSAHRTPDELQGLVKGSDAKVFIAIAGLSAALPGTIAAQTTRPVVGVPVSGKVNLDAILSVTQMPPGVPVAAVGLDRGENAALLAVEILALTDEGLSKKLRSTGRRCAAGSTRTTSPSVSRVFDAKALIEEQVAAIRAAVGTARAIIACSGGVDSTTAAVLASRALGDRLLAVYVDTGLMRKGETDQVSKTLKGLGVTFKVLRAADAFFDALKGVADPEKKRSIIGRMFIELFEREAEGFRAEFLVQGTIAPDWIESGGQLRDRIKTHHNVAGLPATMKLKLVEPLRDLYKDEVRQVARDLGVPVSERQPFPGPGLAVRCLGEITREAIETVREGCAIVEEEIEAAAKAGKMTLPWQYFAVLLPLKSVGVHGDLRVYGRTIAVRAVESVDGMTASYSRIPQEVLDRISTRITNAVKDVNRIVYDVSNKPPATIEWE